MRTALSAQRMAGKSNRESKFAVGPQIWPDPHALAQACELSHCLVCSRDRSPVVKNALGWLLNVSLQYSQNVVHLRVSPALHDRRLLFQASHASPMAKLPSFSPFLYRTSLLDHNTWLAVAFGASQRHHRSCCHLRDSLIFCLGSNVSFHSQQPIEY